MPLTSPDIAKDAVSAPHNHSGRNTPHTGTRTWSFLVTTWECCMCTSVDLCLKNEPVPQNEPQNQAKSQKQKQRQSKNKLVSCPNQGPYLLDRERGDTAGAKLIWLENSWWVGPAMGRITLTTIYSILYWLLDTTVPETKGLGAPHTLIRSGGLTQGPASWTEILVSQEPCSWP